MKYKANKEVVVATHADGGVVASILRSSDDPSICNHYMCIFETEEHARKFAAENVNEPVFFTTKTLATIAKEFNSSILWPGMCGIVYIDQDNMAEHIETDKFIKMAYNSIAEPNKSYGCPFVVDGQIAKVEDIDFNKKYFMMFNRNGHLVTKRTYTKNGKRRDWLVVTTTKEALQKQAAEFGINKKNREVVKETLSSILINFVKDGTMNGTFAGIAYIDDNGAKMIHSKQIVALMSKRLSMLNNMCTDNEIYLDENYFIAVDREYGSPTISTVNGRDFIVVSQRMDTMMKAFKLEGMDTNEMYFTNMMTLREIVELGDADEYDGITLCLDDNPDHMVHITMKNLLTIALDGSGDAEEFDNDHIYISSDNSYMMSERFTMMMDDAYMIAQMESLDGGEVIEVIMMADDEKTLWRGLEQIGYEPAGDQPITRPTYEIFAEFREGQLEECDGIMYFDDNGYCVIPFEAVIETLEEWEKDTDQQSHRVELDFDEPHYVAYNGLSPLAYTQPNGTAFVLVSKNEDLIDMAIEELFGMCDGLEYANDKTLGDVSQEALDKGMGIAMCDEDGVVFIEPKRLRQALYGDDFNS